MTKPGDVAVQIARLGARSKDLVFLAGLSDGGIFAVSRVNCGIVR
jgi:hypothetical protein